MNRTRALDALALACAVLGGACASAPATIDSPRLATLDCPAIEAELARNAEARRAAAQQQHDAWKAVVPFAVAARYGQGKAALAESEQRAAELQRHAAASGCTTSH